MTKILFLSSRNLKSTEEIRKVTYSALGRINELNNIKWRSICIWFEEWGESVRALEM